MATKRPSRPAAEQDYPIHELARIMPEMTAEEFAALRKDIETNGQLDDIVMLDGQIIDGRHRYRALRELGNTHDEIGFREYDENIHGSDPKAFVISGNFHRRHLSAEQKSTIAAEMLGYSPSMGKPKPGAATAKDVAKLAGVSLKSVNRAFNTVTSAKAPTTSPTLESLQKQEKLLVGRLNALRSKIVELQAPAKSKVIARAPASTAIKRPIKR